MIEEEDKHALSNKVRWLENDLAHYKQLYLNAIGERNDLQARVVELEDAIDPDTGNYKQVDEAEEDKSTLDRLNASLTGENEKLRQEIYKLKHDKPDIQGVTQLAADRDFWRNRAQEHAETIDELRQNTGDVTHWRVRSDRFETLSEEKNRRLIEISSRLSEALGKWNTAKRELNTQRQQLDAKEAELRSREHSIRVLDDEVIRLQRELVKEQGERTKLKQEKDRLWRETHGTDGHWVKRQELAREIDRLRKTIYPTPEETISRALIQKWRDSVRRESQQAEQLRTWHVVAVNEPIRAVLNAILKNEEPHSS